MVTLSECQKQYDSIVPRETMDLPEGAILNFIEDVILPKKLNEDEQDDFIYGIALGFISTCNRNVEFLKKNIEEIKEIILDNL